MLNKTLVAGDKTASSEQSARCTFVIQTHLAPATGDDLASRKNAPKSHF